MKMAWSTNHQDGCTAKASFSAACSLDICNKSIHTMGDLQSGHTYELLWAQLNFIAALMYTLFSSSTVTANESTT